LSTASETVDETEEEAAPRPSLVLRLKRLLVAPLLLLRRLRRPKVVAEGEESEDAEPAARDARREEDDEEAEAPAAPPRWRRLLPYGLALLAGAGAGGGAIHWLSAQIIARQSAELGEQQDEVARLKGVLAGYDRMMMKSSRKLEEEQGKRAELENRLAIAQTDLTRRPPPRDTGAPRDPGSPVAGKGPASAGRETDCTLRPGSVGSTLKACLEEFNRQ
jgi:hypothetical protein